MQTTIEAPASPFTAIDTPFPSPARTPAAHLREVREWAPEYREEFRRGGTVDAFWSRSLVTLPYPRRYALWEACRVPVPYVWMTNRMFVIRWRDESGRTRTLVAEPSDYDLGIGTPYLSWELDRLPLSRKRALELLFPRQETVGEHVAALGIRPEEVDYLTFDHLHTQDVRRLVGTRTPQPDLGYPDDPVPPMFPNAKLIVPPDELAQVEDVHPFQARFHQSWTYRDIDRERLLFVEGSVRLGPGLALIRTPGHTYGNQSVVVNTARGIFTSSENGIAVECYEPARSRIPGVARWAREQKLEVLMNFNTPEFASWQYNAMVLEKLLADPIPDAPHFPQVVPSSELTRHRLAPGIRPTYEHGELTITGGEPA